MAQNLHRLSFLHTLQIPVSLLLFFIGAVLGFTESHVVSIAFVFLGIVSLFAGYAVSTGWYIRKLLAEKSYTAHARQSRNSMCGILFAWLMKNKFFARLDGDIRNTVVSGSIRGGKLQTPTESSRRVIIAFACSVPICVVMVSVGVVISGEYLLALLLVVPCIILLFPRISNQLSFADSTFGYEKDLAYFLSYLHITHLGKKMNLYDSMVRLVGYDIFPAIKRDAKMLQRWVKFDGMAKYLAINQLANKHANKRFQSFLFAYFDISRSNPSGLDDFIAKAASIEFEKTITSDERGIGKVSVIFVFGGIAMIMVPALLIMMSFAVPDADIVGMVLLVILVTPLVFTAFAILMYHKKSDHTVRFHKRSLLGLFLIIPCYILTLSDVLFSVSVGLFVTCIINGISVSRQMQVTRSMANGFVPFVRDLIERRKVDSNFVTSIRKIFCYDMEKKYGRFSDVLHEIQHDMDTFSDKRHDVFSSDSINSERLQMMMFVLQSIFDGGHKSTISALERLHSFSQRTIQIKNKLDDTLRMASLLLLFAPLIFFVTLSAISTLMLSFAEHVPAIPDGVHVDADIAAAKYFSKFDVSSILAALKPAIFVMSVCSGIVISRVAYSSFLATTQMGICMGIACVIFVGWDLFFEVISEMVVI